MAIRSRARRIASVASGGVLVCLQLCLAATGAIAWLTTPGGAWDEDVLAGIGTLVLLGVLLAAATALLTAIPVAAGWLSRRWFIVPAMLLGALLARGAYISMAYPAPPYSSSSVFSVEPRGLTSDPA